MTYPKCLKSDTHAVKFHYDGDCYVKLIDLYFAFHD